jgi:hypothetical protein
MMTIKYTLNSKNLCQTEQQFHSYPLLHCNHVGMSTGYKEKKKIGTVKSSNATIWI